VREPGKRLSANQLREMGIDSPLARDDVDLEDAVELLLQLGNTLEGLVGRDFGEVGSALLLRPEAELSPAEFDIDLRDFANRVRVAIGLPLEATRALTDAEMQMVHFFRAMADLIGEDEVISLVRVMGSSASRIARAAISMLRLQFETPITDDSGRLADVLAGYFELIGYALPEFLETNATIMRSHLAHLIATEQMWSVDRSRSATLEPKVIGFADLVGFTAFTERSDAQQFMATMIGFEEAVQSAIVDNDGTLVKLIGDEVMFAADSARSALRVALALSAVGRSGGLEGMRVGLSGGEVITSGGDYFGTVVNIAARIVTLAFADAIVVTEDVATGLEGVVAVESLGMHDLRGISRPVELFRVRP